MPVNPPNDFWTTELEPDLLSTPFRTQTNWHVITGAACSGKTTIIDLLAGRGFKTVPEAARQYFDREIAKGRTIEEIREDQAALTIQVYEIMLKQEGELRPSEVSFLDRALPDAPAFYRYAGMNPNDILSDCFQYRYASVFLLKRLRYQRDGVRVADDATAAYFEKWTLRDYLALGYNVVSVPVLPPDERLAFILERLPEQGLK
jgi:predicted ATPase